MQKLSLNGAWEAHGGQFEDIHAIVPGCIHTDLLRHGLIDDPFYRDNEEKLKWIGKTDWTYERRFIADKALLAHRNIRLVCHGLDTFAEIKINGKALAKTDNMFRTWAFDVGAYLTEGENHISVAFASTFPYIQGKIAERWLAVTDAGGCREAGGNYVRKMQCNYGWDWGPICVTCGIWRDILIEAYDESKIGDVHVTQRHFDGVAELTVNTALKDYGGEELTAKVALRLDGQTVCEAEYPVAGEASSVKLTVDDPKLWWPNNLGEQPLYDVAARLCGTDGKTVDERNTKIGLRTLILDRHEDQWGESFQFVVNGVPFFAKGADWIPLDAFVTRGGEAEYRKLLTHARDANMNFIRVWGGGIYEQDVFYDLCDELGLCVWQDFMFACSAYPVYDKAWLNNVAREAADNIRRLRSHPSLALWCGNNEIEYMDRMVTEEIDEQRGSMSWGEYKRLFDEMLPGLIGEHDGEHAYIPSSPFTPGENRKNANDPTRGDAHLWEVWHGRKPFEWYRTCEHRFNSEFGFQSFPEPAVVESYTLPEDRNIASYVMERHQKSYIGNEAILMYMLSWFRMPKDFDMLLWTSQILQSLAVKYAVEHWRRKMPRGMGTLYWQLNDCWQVASWSSVDYFGNRKALQYAAKKFYAPLLISGVEDTGKFTVDIYLSNDTLRESAGTVDWKLVNLGGKTEASGEFEARIAANASAKAGTLDVSRAVQDAGGVRELVLYYAYVADGKEVSANTSYFVRPKHMKLQKANYRTELRKISDAEFTLTLRADKPALWVWPEFSDIKAEYSDRFFDLDGQSEKTIIVKPEASVTADELKRKLSVYSIADTYQ
ncbi:MAG: glycoside hydrolase family 2 protein [Clostridiales bacterium]|nr:glycoside hydrolase family 2 protein [Clostridiales bacterium]